MTMLLMSIYLFACLIVERVVLHLIMGYLNPIQDQEPIIDSKGIVESQDWKVWVFCSPEGEQRMIEE